MFHPHPGPLPSREREKRRRMRDPTSQFHPHPGPLPSREREIQYRTDAFQLHTFILTQIPPSPRPSPIKGEGETTPNARSNFTISPPPPPAPTREREIQCRTDSIQLHTFIITQIPPSPRPSPSRERENVGAQFQRSIFRSTINSNPEEKCPCSKDAASVSPQAIANDTRPTQLLLSPSPIDGQN